jgi:hypothetical protein
MRYYATDAGLSGTLDLPIHVPQVELMRNDGVVLSTIVIDSSQLLRIRWLNLSIIRVNQDAAPELSNSGFGWAYLGLFGPDFDKTLSTPIVSLSSSQVGVKSTNPWDFADIACAGTYGLVVVNNLINLDVSLSVAGAARLFSGHA